MTNFTQHWPPDGLTADDGQAVRIADGFSWPAFILPPLWLGWHQLWWDLLLWAGVFGAGALALFLWSGDAEGAGWLWLALALITGFEGNDRRRAALVREGWKETLVADPRATESVASP